MKPDTVIRNDGMQILLDNLGILETERFIMLMKRESFDYTKWRENLFEDMSIEEISAKAARLRQRDGIGHSEYK